MTPATRPSSAPGSGRGGRGRRPVAGSSTRTTRSTTRAAAPDGPASPGRSRGATLTGRAAVLLLVLAVLAMSYASSARAWLRQRGEINDLTATIAAQKSAIGALQQEKRRWQDPAYIRMQARLRFGWVMPRETGYRVIGDNGKILADGASSLSQPVEPTGGQSSQWWDDVWQSVVAAGGVSSSKPTQPTGSARTPAGHIDKTGKTTTGTATRQSQHQGGKPNDKHRSHTQPGGG